MHTLLRATFDLTTTYQCLCLCHKFPSTLGSTIRFRQAIQWILHSKSMNIVVNQRFSLLTQKSGNESRLQATCEGVMAHQPSCDLFVSLHHCLYRDPLCMAYLLSRELSRNTQSLLSAMYPKQIFKQHFFVPSVASETCRVGSVVLLFFPQCSRPMSASL